jgi:hypothetical protein
MFSGAENSVWYPIKECKYRAVPEFPGDDGQDRSQPAMSNRTSLDTAWKK